MLMHPGITSVNVQTRKLVVWTRSIALPALTAWIAVRMAIIAPLKKAKPVLTMQKPNLVIKTVKKIVAKEEKRKVKKEIKLNSSLSFINHS
jgi:hypothetical protein